MVKRYMRTVLALLLCCAMLASNLGFAEELAELAAEVAAEAELAPEAALEEAAEPEAALESEEPAPEADEAEAEPEEVQDAEPETAPEQATEPEADAAPEDGEVAEPEAPEPGEAAEPEAPEQDAEPAPDDEMGEGALPELTPEEEHPVVLDPAAEESLETEALAAEPCNHLWHWDHDLRRSVCANCGMDNPCRHANREDDCSDVPSYLWDDAPQDLGNGMHGGMGWFATWYHCLDCGSLFDVTYYDGGLKYYEAAHYWNTDVDPFVCEDCGAVTTCKHPNKEYQEYIEWRDGAPNSNGVGSHGGIGARAHRWYCPDCDWGWGDELEENFHEITEGHDWNPDGNSIVCEDCGAKNDCAHPNKKSNTYIEWQDAPRDNGDGGHTGMGATMLEWHCPDCDYWWDDHLLEDYHEITEEHDWGEDDRCRICGCENPCDHADFRTERWEEPDWDRGNPVVVSNETSHQVWACTISEKVCVKCGARFDRKTERVDYKVTGEHSYSYDEEEDVIWCDMCHRVSECDHPNAEILNEGDNFNIDEGDSRNQIGEDTHKVYGIYCYHKYCPDCDVDYWEYEDGVAEGEHDWEWSYDEDNRVSLCIYCHKVNPCRHENGYEAGNRLEPDPRYQEQAVIDSDKNGHTFHAVQVSWMYCPDCDSDYDWTAEPVAENGGVVTQEHQWDYDDPDRCWICDWANSCDHPEEECEINWENVYPNEDIHVEWCNEFEHRVSNLTWEAGIHCNKCGADYHAIDDEFVLEGGHEWDTDADGNVAAVCWACGYENPCTHPDYLTREIVWWEDEDGADDNGNGTHHGLFRQVHKFHCDQCDGEWGYEPIGSGAYVEMDLPHEWDEDNECRSCSRCPAANPCRHEDARETGIDVDYGDEFSVAKRSSDEHTVRGVDVYHHWYCPDCKQEYDTVDEDVEYTGEHEWNDEDGASCWVCSYSNPCDHPDALVEHKIWDETADVGAGGIVFANDRQHKVYKRMVESYLCHKCGAEWGWNELSVDKTPVTEPHSWYWNDEEGSVLCEYCQYESSCDHADREYRGDWWGWWDGHSRVISSDEHGHVIEGMLHQTRYYCRTCDCDFVETEEGATWEGDHEWDIDEAGNAAAKCWACDYENPCEHPDAMVEVSIAVERDESYPDNGIISRGTKSHTMHAIRIQHSYCHQCDTEIGWEVIGEGFETTAPHEWDGDDEGRYCLVCDYENPCDHADAECVDDWFAAYDGQTDRNATGEGHTLRGDHYYQWHCDACGADYETVDEGVTEFREGHNWVWEDGRSYCLDCGYENRCKHISTEEWSGRDLCREKGGITSANAKGHTGWFIEYTGRYCRDCDAVLDVVEKAPALETLPHEWNSDEDGASCWLCDWENSCDHDGTLEVWDMRECHLSEDTSCNQITVQGHQVYCDARVWVYCTNCGAEFETWQKDELFVGEHEWDTDPQGVVRCIYCNYVNRCEHKNYNLTTDFALDPERSSATPEGHTIYGTQYYGKICVDCGMEFDMDEKELTQPITGAHLYEVGVEDGERCVMCGYERPACDHPQSARIVTSAWIDFDPEAGVMGSDAAGHTVSVVKIERICCGKCGMMLDYEYVDRSNAKTVTMAHSFDLDDGTVCGVCGWKNACTHEGSIETVELYEGYGGEFVSRSATEHTSYGIRFTMQHCKRCDAYWGREIVNGCELVTEPHNWDRANGTYCYSCLYQSTCDHAGATVKTHEQRILLPELTDDSTHTMAVMKTTYYHCDKCGADYGYSYENVEMVAEPHGAGATCPDCGFASGGKVDLTALSFAEASVTLGVGETYLPKLNKTPVNATSAIAFRSDAPSVFSVSDAGQIKAIAPGSGTLTATSNGKTATLKVQVEANLGSISLSAKSLTLSVGETAALTAKVGGSGSIRVNWTTSDASTATVAADGTVRGVDRGEAVITATLFNGESASCSVTVLSAPSTANMLLKIGKSKIGAGESTTAILSYVDSHGDYEITSSNSNVASVKKSGSAYTITGGSAGSATITARAFNGAEVSQKITVVGTPDKLKFANKPSKMGVGEKYALIVELSRSDGLECSGEVTFTSNKTGVISVDANGVLTANKSGSATITAKCGKLKASAKISVKKSATAISLDRARLSLGLKEAPVTLKATLLPKGTAANVHWSSDKPEIAGVDPYSGEVSPVDIGTATITASISDGKIAAHCVVTVYEAPKRDTIEVVPAKLRVAKGDMLDVAVRFSNGTGGGYTLSSSDAKILKYDKKTGKFKAAKAGTAQIIATAWNGVTAQSATITVTPTPTGVKQVPKSQTLMAGDYFVIAPTIAPVGAETVLTVKSSDPAVATVEEQINDETGAKEYCVTAKTNGTAKITFTTANKKKATCKVIVKSAPTQIALNKLELELVYAGSAASNYTTTEKMKATLAPKGCAGKVEWLSEDTGVAVVDVNGKVIPHGYGHTTIWAYVANGDGDRVCEASCEVSVKNQPTAENTKLEPKDDRAPVNGRIQLRAGQSLETKISYIGSAGEKKSGSYKSSDTKIATVNKKSGKITAKKAGTATISVKMYNGVTLELLLEVIP